MEEDLPVVSNSFVLCFKGSRNKVQEYINTWFNLKKIRSSPTKTTSNLSADLISHYIVDHTPYITFPKRG